MILKVSHVIVGKLENTKRKKEKVVYIYNGILLSHIYIYTYTHTHTYTPHLFFVQSSVDGHLGSFHVLASNF